MPKVLWHTFNSASVFQSGRSECHSRTSCLLQREGPIRFVVSCLSERNLLFRKRALSSSRTLWLEKLVVPHMYVAAVPPCGHANQKLTASPPIPHHLPSRSLASWERSPTDTCTDKMKFDFCFTSASWLKILVFNSIKSQIPCVTVVTNQYNQLTECARHLTWQCRYHANHRTRCCVLVTCCQKLKNFLKKACSLCNHAIVI